MTTRMASGDACGLGRSQRRSSAMVLAIRRAYGPQRQGLENTQMHKLAGRRVTRMLQADTPCSALPMERVSREYS